MLRKGYYCGHGSLDHNVVQSVLTERSIPTKLSMPLHELCLDQLRDYTLIIPLIVSYKKRDVITHPCYNFCGGLIKPSLKSGHGCMITYQSTYDCDYLPVKSTLKYIYICIYISGDVEFYFMGVCSGPRFNCSVQTLFSRFIGRNCLHWAYAGFIYGQKYKPYITLWVKIGWDKF